MNLNGDDPSVFKEGFDHVRPAPDSIAEEPALTGAAPSQSGEERAHQNVWDEPAFQAAGVAPPEDAVTYARWYQDGIERCTAGQSRLAVTGLILGGGVFAILGALLTEILHTAIPLIGVVVIAPLAEEMMKIGAALIVLETRPFLFRNQSQVLLVVLASALSFAVLENLLYLNVYIPEPDAALILWRWTLCTAMHTGASTIAALGLLRMRRHALATFAKPRVQLAYPYIVTAILVHATYNAFAVVYSALYFPNG